MKTKAEKPRSKSAVEQSKPSPQQAEAIAQLGEISKRIKSLDSRLGVGLGAKRERERLAASRLENEAVIAGGAQ